MQLKKVVMGLTACSFIMGLTGCITVDSIFGEMDKPVSSVELQAIQTREFQATEEQTFGAVISTFQDYGYIINSADRSTGMVLAKTTSEAEIMPLTSITRVEYNKATAFIEKIAKDRVKVRVSVVKYVSATGAYGGGGEKEVMRTNPQIYQEIFAKIQHSLFLKKNL